MHARRKLHYRNFGTWGGSGRRKRTGKKNPLASLLITLIFVWPLKFAFWVCALAVAAMVGLYRFLRGPKQVSGGNP